MTPSHLVHLYNRIGFGLSPRVYRKVKGRKRAEAVASLLAPTAERESLLKMPVPAEIAKQEMYALRADWMRRMANPTSDAVLERMSMFWHDHFACLPIRANIALDYLNLIRINALGNFRTLLLGMATDTALMRYLNANSIRKDYPNENFAREILELFTVGIEHYTEADVKGLARSFAGWGLDAEENFFLRRGQIDTGDKTIFGITRNFSGLEALNLIVDDERTARFLTRKLWSYLTDHLPTPAIVERHSKVLFASNYEIIPWLKSILLDDDFYHPDLVGRKVKSPTDLLVMWARQLEAPLPTNTDRFVNFARFNGELLLAPPSVAGWPGGKAWISSATLPFRQLMPPITGTTKLLMKGPNESFEGLQGFAAASVDKMRGDKDLSICLLGHPNLTPDPLALASHSRYQYA